MRTILITGASGGLAQEMVKLLPEDRLILLGRNQEKLEKLYASHPQAECIGIDIRPLIAFLTSRCRRCLRSIPLPSCSFHA